MKVANSVTETENRTIRIIQEEEINVDGSSALYRLCECRFAVPQYYVEIIFRGERSAVYIGENEKHAVTLFCSLVRGSVTPCTLGDIIEDAQNA